MPTPIPLTWKRISIGQEFERDTVTAIVIDPKDRDVLYARMKNAGIYKSIDGGLSWRPAHQGLSNTHVKSLLIDSQKPRILYAGTIGGIFKTEDGSENWSRIGEGIFLLMDPQDSSHLYARDAEGIYEAADQGKSWQTVYSTEEGCPGKIHSWAIHPVDGKMLFIDAGEECEPGRYLSNDGGHTWILIQKIDNIVCLDGGLVIGLDEQGNYVINSICSGQSDTYDSTGSSYYYCDSNLCKFSPKEGQTVKFGKPDVGIFTSITISPYDPNTIYVTGEGVSVSKDGGLTWTKLNNGLGSGVLQLDAGAGDAPILYIQPGECDTWELWSAKRKQSLYISTDDGNTWNFVLQEGCRLIKDADGSTLYRIGESTEMWRSQDEGRSWQRVLTPNYFRTIVAHASQTGLLYGFKHDPYYQNRVNPNVQEKEYFYSDDYGHTWKRMDSVTSTKPCFGSTLRFIDEYRPVAIDPRDGNHVFVIDNGALLESHDSCDTTSAFATTPNTSMNSIAFDPNNPDILYAGTDEGAYVSFDSGQTWGLVNDGLLGATVVYSIAVDKDSNVYAATPYGVFKLENK